MLTQFYGVIQVNANGASVHPQCVSSDNFTVTRKERGEYEIVLGEWIAQENQPVVTVAPYLGGNSVVVRCTAVLFTAGTNTNTWTITVKTWDGDPQSPEDRDFQFSVQCGNTHIEKISNLEIVNGAAILDATIKSFNGGTNNVLALSTKLQNGAQLWFDKATRIELISSDPTVPDMSLKIRLNYIPGPSGYELKGYLYGPGTPTPPLPWNNNETTLTLNGDAPETFQQRIVVTAANPSTSAFLSSDPIIRLSRTPPGGMVLP